MRRPAPVRGGWISCQATSEERCAPPGGAGLFMTAVAGRSALPDRGRPTDGHYDGVLDCCPGVSGARTPHDVVTGLGKIRTAVAELDDKVTADEDHQCRTPIVRRPLLALLAGRVNTPLHLDVVAAADTLRRVNEVADQPSSGVPGCPQRRCRSSRSLIRRSPVRWWVCWCGWRRVGRGGSGPPGRRRGLRCSRRRRGRGR